MAAKTKFEPGEIPIVERNKHMVSLGGQSELQRNTLFDDVVPLLSSDMTLDGFELKTVFEEYDPEELIQVIGRYGVKWLGTMEIEEWLVDREFGGRTTITIGRDDDHTRDWERMWMDRLFRGRPYNEPDRLVRNIKVEAYVVTIKNASGVRQQGLLFPLLQRWESNACPIDVWGLATVRALVSYKWNHWARKYVTIQLVFYILWMAFFLILACGYHEEHDNKSLIHLWRHEENGKITVLSAIGCHIFMLPFSFICIRRMLGSAWKWFNFWDIIDVVLQVFQTICTLYYVFEIHIDSDFFKICLATQCILLVAKIQYFARTFVAVESSMLDTLKAVLGNIKWYLLLLVVTLYSFSCAFHILYRDEKYDDEECEDFKSIHHSIMSMFSLMFGEWEMSNYLEYSPFNETYFNETFFNKEHEQKCNGTTNLTSCDYAKARKKEFFEKQNACLIRDTCIARNMTCSTSGFGEYRPTLVTQTIIMFFIIYMVVMTILFYHLLIAMIIDSHSRQMEVRKLWVHLSRAEIINILETALPRYLTEKYTCAYIHVLRIVPMRDANCEKIWKQISENASAYEIARGEFDTMVHQIELDILSRIEGISDRIRETIGCSEQEYKNLVFKKMELSQKFQFARMRTVRGQRLSRRMSSIPAP